jgi:hypothetical protein
MQCLAARTGGGPTTSVLAVDELSAVRSPHFPGPLCRKITFHDEPADLGVQTLDLALAVGPAITIVVFEMLASRAREAASSRRKFDANAPDSVGPDRPPSPAPATPQPSARARWQPDRRPTSAGQRMAGQLKAMNVRVQALSIDHTKLDRRNARTHSTNRFASSQTASSPSASSTHCW